MIHHAREYETTHPWLHFELNVESLGAVHWMLLGEIRSKVEHLRNTPLKPETAQEMRTVSLARGAHATVAIEGGTLTEDQVRQAVDGTLELPASQQYREQEIDNVITAFNQINLGADEHGNLFGLTFDGMQDINRQVLNELPREDWIRPGEISLKAVGVARYLGAPREDCEYLLERLCEWINGSYFRRDESEDWQCPLRVIAAIVAHVYFELIHPFGDGNGRVGRMLEFQVLRASGVPSVAAHLLTNHYNETRDEYHRHLAAVSARDDLIPFLQYAVRGFAEQLTLHIEQVHEQQWADRWEQLIYERFGNRNSEADVRRRNLALAISRQGLEGLVRIADIPTLTPKLAAAYATKSAMTVTRDINALVELELIERDGRRSVRPLVDQLAVD